ncbi:hypothetical protein HNO89_004050 [Sporosarcina luteola]|nr:hypothetical protein [Sporosarcina luteola]
MRKKTIIICFLCLLIAISVSGLIVAMNKERLREGDQTTFVEVNTNDLFTKQTFYTEDLDVNKQIGLSNTIILKGKVAAILESVETNDLVDSGIVDARSHGYNYLHTDVVIQVDEYLGENKLDYDMIVVRHIGGRIGNFVHVSEMESLTVNEEVLLFRLEQPAEMTQVPEGFTKEQYFLFTPNSKYIHRGNGVYSPDFKNEGDITLRDIREKLK